MGTVGALIPLSYMSAVSYGLQWKSPWPGTSLFRFIVCTDPAGGCGHGGGRGGKGGEGGLGGGEDAGGGFGNGGTAWKTSSHS
ncbi:MAG: hypothetical protein CMD92_08060 [Gammaproteobacteria bacterium]|nr:hypothetical protein [Gammaproteobacteria bacterium]